MSKRIYIANDENWDVFFAHIGMDMESENVDKETRLELKKAYQHVKEVDILNDIRDIVNTYIGEEESHFIESEENEENVDSHIFLALNRLRKMLEIVEI